MADGTVEVLASVEADTAFRNALPPLSGYENICDFVACIAHAILIEAIQMEQASKLLYAAQIALSAIRCQPAIRAAKSE